MDKWILILSSGALVAGYAVLWVKHRSNQAQFSDAQKKTDRKINQLLTEANRKTQKMEADASKRIAQEESARRQALSEEARDVEKRLGRVEEAEAQLLRQESRLNEEKAHIQSLKDQWDSRHQELANQLENIANFTQEEAKAIIIKQAEEAAEQDVGTIIKQSVAKAKETAKEQARELVVNAIQRTAVNVVAAVTTTAVQLPNEELKGRIIGKEGRNIRAFETATGCDIIIDDSPDTVTLSCFNPIRREIGRIALTDLVSDGRINPARIEESVKNAEANLEKTIIGIGQEAAEELRLKFHPKLIELIGRLNYRTSYGQNILKHSMEAAHIAGILATELGLDVDLAKRGTLLHDIGKALDFETEGSHVDIGDTVCRKYGESEAVINCINAHHEDEAPATIEAVIVMMADAISSARPGARRESIEKYIERLTKLEAIAKTFDGVKKVFAIQAGREVRVLVEPSEVRDNRMYKLARDIAKRIESEVDYPGEVTVSLIRETRAYSTAK